MRSRSSACARARSSCCPRIEVTGGYDTNPGRVPAGRASTLLTVVAGTDRAVRLDAPRGHRDAARQLHDLRPDARTRPARASTARSTGRLDVTRNTSLIGEGKLIVGTDNPGSPNVQAGLRASRSIRRSAARSASRSASIASRSPSRARPSAPSIRTRSSPTARPPATTTATTTATAARCAPSYDLMPGLKPFVEVGADTREHDLRSTSSECGATPTAGRQGRHHVRVLAQAHRRNRDRLDRAQVQGPVACSSCSGFLFDASLIYSMSALTKREADRATTVAGETTVPARRACSRAMPALEVEHAFRRWLIGAVKFNYGLDDYVGSARKDDRYSISAHAHLQARPRGS